MYFEYLPFLVFLFCTEQIAITGIRDCCYAGCRKHTYIADIWNLVDSHIQDVCEMLSQCRNLPENGKIAWFRWKSIDHFSTFLFLAFLQPKILAFSTGPPFFVVILEENIVVGTAFQRFAIYKLFHTKTKKMLCIEMNLCTSRRCWSIENYIYVNYRVLIIQCQGEKGTPWEEFIPQFICICCRLHGCVLCLHMRDSLNCICNIESL